MYVIFTQALTSKSYTCPYFLPFSTAWTASNIMKIVVKQMMVMKMCACMHMSRLTHLSISKGLCISLTDKTNNW